LTHLKKNIRLDWIDYARGIAIILVVYRHMFEGLKRTKAIADAGINVDSYTFLEHANIFFFSFRMPLFFIVSGVFVGSSLAKRGLNALAENKARTILYPYFLWGIIQITIQIVFSAFINSKKSFGDYGYLFYSPREVEQFWYLYALFNVTVIYAFLKAKAKFGPAQQIGLGLILFFVSAIFAQYKIEWGFVNDIFHYYVFLALGDALSQSILKGKLRSFFFSWKAVSLLAVPFILSQYYFLTVNIAHKDVSPKYLYVEFDQPVMYLLIALVGCAFIIAISSILERYNTAKWLRYLGRHSLYIYVMHVIVFAAVRVVLTKFLKIYDVYALMAICITAGLIIPVLFFKLTERIGWQFLFTLEPQRKQKKAAIDSVRTPQPTYES
jgi:fucose 4-O-acetylase-like acetyltransferase